MQTLRRSEGVTVCGRYALYGPKSRLRDDFDADFIELEERPNPYTLFNIAPTQSPPIVWVRPDGARVIIPARWGLLPSWVKEPAKLSQPINAKVETAGEKPMFRHAFKKSRVLIPASGFYEWQPVAGGKQPFYIRPVGREFFGFGGLLEHWHGPEGTITTFAVLTTAANELMRPIHDRMPVIIRPEDYGAWLDPNVTDSALIRELAGEYPAELMMVHPVGKAVGNPRASGPSLVDPVPLSGDNS